MSLILYGIPNCDSVRKARTYLDEQQIPYTFIDIHREELTTEQLTCWLATFGTSLVNKRSLTYRQHKNEAIQAIERGERDIITLLQTYPTMIKRPILERENLPILLGWNEKQAEHYLEKL